MNRFFLIGTVAAKGEVVPKSKKSSRSSTGIESNTKGRPKRKARVFAGAAAEEQAFAEEVSELVKVWLGLRWKPQTGSPVIVRSIQVNGYDILTPAGIPDGESPFKHSLGSHKKGKSIKVAWKVESYSDCQGIKAFIASGEAGKWKGYPSKEPFEYLDIYESTVSYLVPLD